MGSASLTRNVDARGLTLASPTQQFEGTCHCQAIAFVYRTALAPENWQIRACQCSFCRSHAALSTSDPAGALEFVERGCDAIHRYQFGQRTADFLLCRSCGVYVGTAMQLGDKRFGVINVRTLRLSAALPEPVVMTYEGETVAERQTRREKRWTPIVGGV